MPKHRPVRSCVLATAVAAALLAPAVPAVQAAETASAAPATFRAAPAAHPYDEVERLAKAPRQAVKPAPAPGGTPEGRIPGPGKAAKAPRATAPAPRTAAGVPCTLDGVSGLAPEEFADFLADPAVTADGCLRGLVWTWDARLARVMSDAHVQAVSRRVSSLAASHDGRDGSHLLEMFTYLHAVVYHDFSRDEIDITDPATTDAVRGAIDSFGTAARSFDATPANAETLREALYAGSAPGLRQHQLGLVKKVLATMDRSHAATYADARWGGAALAALSVNYLGVYPGNRDSAFHTAAARDDSYRAAFKAFAGYAHLKGTPNEWVVRDAVMEYGRFGQIDVLRDALVPDLGTNVLPTAQATFGRGSDPWIKTVSWLTYYGACAPYGVCKEDIEKWLFPDTYTYDSGGIKVRTALSRPVVDQLYYASKQVKAQFHRVLGSEQPLAGDPNATLNIVLYASRADYENYHPLLTGMGTDNGGVYIEQGATFYTYQRRVPQDSSLTLEELFRHEYVHYLNGRFAVPGSFGEGPWYQDDRTTAMDEGTAEFFDGATRSDGVAARRSLVRSVINDTADGGPRMTVNQLLHATYTEDGFRFYPYAGTFFEYLWSQRPGVLRQMYRNLRANDPAAFDAWRDHLGTDPAIQREYDAFLDARIAEVDRLFVPNTTFTPNEQLEDSSVVAVRSAFASATYQNPDCVENGDPGKRRFLCTGRITANLSAADNPDQVFKDMSETVDYFILDRAGAASHNLADMNCSFGEVDIWSDRRAGTSTYTCEGPLRS
ncbi:collagenase [Streptomyces palmae]|uniref:microbial collagenase n=1 Tax=Streptomyces palmae TaxID=1701085 RepID=A0A4Z0GK00_9ACTN|nr:collagenase [Streptomyces palmae]TGA97191.1 collagenase [Streptomyces palmae]